MAMSRATVVVCDDAREARALLRSLPRYDPSIEIVGEASDGLEAIEAVGPMAKTSGRVRPLMHEGRPGRDRRRHRRGHKDL